MRKFKSRGAVFAALSVLTAIVVSFAIAPQSGAVPASKPQITAVPGPAGQECRKIATGAVDHGEDNAQKFADELLEGDIKAFKASHGIKSLKVTRRFRKCKFHLWFLGNEYNCTSGAIVCWPR